MNEEMPRLEILAAMLSIKALLETGNTEKAKETPDEVITGAKRREQ